MFCVVVYTPREDKLVWRGRAFPRRGRAVWGQTPQMFRKFPECITCWDGGLRGRHGRKTKLCAEVSQVPWISPGGQGQGGSSYPAVWVDWKPGWVGPGDKSGHSQDERFEVGLQGDHPLVPACRGGLHPDGALLSRAGTSQSKGRVGSLPRETRLRTKVSPTRMALAWEQCGVLTAWLELNCFPAPAACWST